MTVSEHAAERYRHRVRPWPELQAARHELNGLRAIGAISAQQTAWLGAANRAPYRSPIGGGAIVLPLPPQAGAWVATSYVRRRTLAPTRREANAAHKASLAARKRARGATRS